MDQMEKSQQVCHTPRQRWERATGSCSCWTGFPRLSGGNRRAGSLLFGLLTYLTNLYFKIREDRRKGGTGRVIQ